MKELTAEQVWEAMREACHWSLEECGAPSCTFAACPLLKEARDA